MPSSAITTSAIVPRYLLPFLTPGENAGARGIWWIEAGFQIGEDWVQRGAERDQKTVVTFAVPFSADIAFPKARDDAAQVLAVTADITAIPKILCAGGCVSVEAPQHIQDVAIHVVEQT